MNIVNAKITDTFLGREDHGHFTFCLYVNMEKCSVGIGGYSLDQYDRDTKKRVFRAESMEAISKILSVVGVNKWEDLPGKYIRVEDVRWGDCISKIGNIIEDNWFDMKQFFSNKE